MENLEKQLERLEEESFKITKELNSLKENKFVKKYLELRTIDEKNMNERRYLYAEIRKNEIKQCNHIWVTSKIVYDCFEGRSESFFGCIKCGVNQTVLEKDPKYQSTEEKIMYDYLRENYCTKGIHSSMACDLDLGKALYLKIKEQHPDIDDETACKYFEIALDNIRDKKESQDRKNNRAKRLSLDKKFNRWNVSDIKQ